MQRIQLKRAAARLAVLVLAVFALAPAVAVAATFNQPMNSSPIALILPLSLVNRIPYLPVPQCMLPGSRITATMAIDT